MTSGTVGPWPARDRWGKVERMSRPARRPQAAARIALLALAVIAGPLLPTGSWVGGAGPTWPVATSGPTVLTSGIWFRGRGFGHGVGLSQHGARGRAIAGQTHATILAHYFKGTSLGTVTPTQTVRVLVLSGFSSTATSPFVLFGRRGPFTVDGLVGSFPADSAVRLTRSTNGWLVTVVAANGSELARADGVTDFRVRPADAISLLELPPRPSSYDTYRGTLRVRAGTAISVVNEIALDLYLRGVVPAEMPSSWQTEALRAQAIAARGYSVRRLHPTTGTYDLTDDTSTQVYQGWEGETAAANRAISDTAGIVVKSGTAVANTMFHSTGGAATEHNENAFVSSSGAKIASPVSYLRGSQDLRADGTSYDDGSPYAYWKTDTYSLAALSAIFAADARTSVGSLISLDLSSRGVSGRLIKVVLRGSAGSKTVSGDVFRSVFNAKNTAGRPDMRSTLIDLVQATVPSASATSPSPTAAPTSTLVASTPAPTPKPAATPAPTPVPTPLPTPKPTANPTAKPAATSLPTPKPTAKAAPESRPPSRAAAETSEPDPGEPGVSNGRPIAGAQTMSTSASTMPDPVLDGITLVGPSPPLSSNDAWIAFSARPSTDREGSDVYVWRPGLASASALTGDHRSLFAGWVGGLALVSSIVVDHDHIAGVEPPDTTVRSVLIDPASGHQVGDPIAGAWRPSIDPDGGFAVFWEGTVARDRESTGWRPTTGRLVIARFRLERIPFPAGIPVSPGSWPTLTPVVTGTVPLADAGVAGWDVLWDVPGGRASVWILDEDGSSRLVTFALADVPSPDGPSAGAVPLQW